MVATNIILCNMALTKVGALSITALSDDTASGIACNLQYDPSRRAMLRRHPWNAAVKRVSITPTQTVPGTNDVPVFGCGFLFSLPSDCLRVLDVNQGDTSFSIEGARTLVCDDTTAEIRYIYDLTDTTKFDSLLDELIAAHLAWSICYKLTQSAARTQVLYGELKELLKSSKTINGQEQFPQAVSADYLLEARLFGGDVAQPMRNFPETPV